MVSGGVSRWEILWERFLCLGTLISSCCLSNNQKSSDINNTLASWKKLMILAIINTNIHQRICVLHYFFFEDLTWYLTSLTLGLINIYLVVSKSQCCEKAQERTPVTTRKKEGPSALQLQGTEFCLQPHKLGRGSWDPERNTPHWYPDGSLVGTWAGNSGWSTINNQTDHMDHSLVWLNETMSHTM